MRREVRAARRGKAPTNWRRSAKTAERAPSFVMPGFGGIGLPPLMRQANKEKPMASTMRDTDGRDGLPPQPGDPDYHAPEIVPPDGAGWSGPLGFIHPISVRYCSHPDEQPDDEQIHSKRGT